MNTPKIYPITVDEPHALVEEHIAIDKAAFQSGVSRNEFREFGRKRGIRVGANLPSVDPVIQAFLDDPDLDFFWRMIEFFGEMGYYGWPTYTGMRDYARDGLGLDDETSQKLGDRAVLLAQRDWQDLYDACADFFEEAWWREPK